MKAHAKDFVAVSRFPESLRFETRGSEDHCAYCGSMTVAKAIALLATPGAHYSGADWKYNWPHKLYLGLSPGKFYAEHLLDSPPEELARFAELSAGLLGIRYEVDDQGLKYRAVRPGFQTWGVVGGAPADGAPLVPPEWWK